MGRQNRAAEDDEEYNHARQRQSENSELAVPLATPLTPNPTSGLWPSPLWSGSAVANK